MTTLTLEQQAGAVCQYCRLGFEPFFRSETQEWVHSIHGQTVIQGVVCDTPGSFTHTMCGAHELRMRNGQPL